MPDRPHHTEKMKRCVEEVMAKGHDESSAYAICTAQFEKAGEPTTAEAHEEPRFLTLRNATGEVRIEQWQGKDWTVVPVVALVEGVIHPVNAPEPELVRAEEFRDCAGWEGVPVHAGHPMKNGVPVSGRAPDTLPLAMGVVRNASAAADRLLMEAWLDPSKCPEGTPAGRVLQRVTAKPPEMVEVSVGVFTTAEKSHGVWRNGKRYAAEWRGMRQDHLALLDTGKRGACSIEMGCGTPRAAAMRVAENGQLEMEENVAEPKTGIRGLLANVLRALMPRGWGDDEVKQELRDALLAVEPAFKNGEIVRVLNDAVIYCLYPPVPAYYDAAPMPMTYWKRGYSFDTSTQKFTVDAERTQVEPTTVYVPTVAQADGQGIVPENAGPEPTPRAACACGNHAAPAAGEVTMQRSERIAALVANPHNTVKSTKMLEAATDDELKALEDQAATLKTAAEQADADKKAREKTESDLKAAQDALAEAQKPKPFSMEQLPAEIRALVDAEKTRQQAEKDALVGQLKAAQSTYTEDELKAKDVPELKKLAALAKVEAPRDFSGQAVPRAAQQSDEVKRPDPWAKLTAAR